MKGLIMFECDQVSGSNKWRLVRISVGSTVEVVLLSARFLPLSVHWIEKSTPCCGALCPLCERYPVRGLYYVAVGHEGHVRLLEVGCDASMRLEQHCKLL